MEDREIVEGMLDLEVWARKRDRVPPLLRDDVVPLYVLVEQCELHTDEEVIATSVDSSGARPLDGPDEIFSTFNLLRKEDWIVEVWSDNSETKDAVEEAEEEAEKELIDGVTSQVEATQARQPNPEPADNLEQYPHALVTLEPILVDVFVEVEAREEPEGSVLGMSRWIAKLT